MEKRQKRNNPFVRIRLYETERKVYFGAYHMLKRDDISPLMNQWTAILSIVKKNDRVVCIMLSSYFTTSFHSSI